MAKRTTSKKETTSMTELNPAICKLKHEVIEKEFSNIKSDAERRHEEIKELMKSVKEAIIKDVKISNTNLKDKIVLVDKTVGDKIDSLSDFDDTLKGNGTPGVWESIRSINKMMKILMSIVTVIVILELGGSVNRINWDKLREKLWGPPTVAEQVEPVKEAEIAHEPDKKFGAMEEGKSFYVPPEKEMPEEIK